MHRVPRQPQPGTTTGVALGFGSKRNPHTTTVLDTQCGSICYTMDPLGAGQLKNVPHRMCHKVAGAGQYYSVVMDAELSATTAAAAPLVAQQAEPQWKPLPPLPPMGADHHPFEPVATGGYWGTLSLSHTPSSPA